MIDWPAKLALVAEEYNAALYREADLEKKLAAAREMRVQLFGKAQAVQQMFEEHLAEESVAASGNGHSEAKVKVKAAPKGSSDAEV